MKEIRQQVYQYIEQNGMFYGCRNIIAGVSGGADSVCLLILLRDYIRERCLPISLKVVHINHGLRKEAQADEDFTRALCHRLGIACQCEHIDCSAVAQRERLSLEEAGRRERYRIFAQYAGSLPDSRIAVAHHKNDQAETVIMNMVRGSSLKGMGGMQPVRDNICRPLLCLTRRQIEQFLDGFQQEYVTDLSNYDNQYTRNVIRNRIIPVLEESTNVRAVDNICAMAQHVREAEEYIAGHADRAYAAVVRQNQQGLCIDIEAFRKLEGLIGKWVIYRCISETAGEVKDIAAVHVKQILELFSAQVGKRVTAGHAVRAVRDYDTVVISRYVSHAEECVKRGQVVKNTQLPGGIGQTQAQVFHQQISLSRIQKELCIPMNVNIYVEGRGMVFLRRLIFKIRDNKCEIYGNKSDNDYAKIFDYDKIEKELIVRFRKPGDRFVLTGNKLKKLKKEFIDRKIPERFRDSVLLICGSEGVLWACGVRRCEDYLVSDSTVRVIEMQLDFE